jgi:hypothetical protein
MIPLIDGDILPFEIGFGAEYQSEGSVSFDLVREMIVNKINSICYAVGATAPPKIFLSGGNNFREDIAKRKGYKLNREGKKKPFHWENIRAYLIHVYGATVVDGYEADDALAMAQTGNTVICSRDKDLRQVPGMHYSWECGAQGEIGPYLVGELGEFWTEKLPRELKGTGYRFFAAQCLMGDSVDNIPGLKGWGPVKTYNHLKDATTVNELNWLLLCAFHSVYGDSFISELCEQADLVWMVRELAEDNKPITWSKICH